MRDFVADHGGVETAWATYYNETLSGGTFPDAGVPTPIRIGRSVAIGGASLQ